MLIEDVHFRAATHRPGRNRLEGLGARASATSPPWGATPRFCLLSLALPEWAGSPLDPTFLRRPLETGATALRHAGGRRPGSRLDAALRHRRVRVASARHCAAPCGRTAGRFHLRLRRVGWSGAWPRIGEKARRGGAISNRSHASHSAYISARRWRASAAMGSEATASRSISSAYASNRASRRNSMSRSPSSTARRSTTRCTAAKTTSCSSPCGRGRRFPRHTRACR